MSTNGHENDSESMKAARNAPPLPHERGRERVEGDESGFGAALPLLLSLGGAAATAIAGLAVDRATHSDAAGRARRGADSLYDSAKDSGESMLSAGAKAAGVAGLLKAVGKADLSGGLSTAAKAVAAKKLVEYAGSFAAGGTKRAGRLAANHPALTAAGTAGLFKARSAAKEGGGRVRDAYGVLRHGRESIVDRRDESSATSAAITGIALLGIGAAALYLFDPDRGRHRRRVLRENVLGAGRRAADYATDYATDAADAARSAASGEGAEPPPDAAS